MNKKFMWMFDQETLYQQQIQQAQALDELIKQQVMHNNFTPSNKCQFCNKTIMYGKCGDCAKTIIDSECEVISETKALPENK